MGREDQPVNLAKLLARPQAVPPIPSKADGVAVIRISDRNAIPLSEHYVLVMEGLSTYLFEHVRGASFVVDNSTFNLEHDKQYREALAAASAMARAKGLPAIYVLD
jgi:hypothetical protein